MQLNRDNFVVHISQRRDRACQNSETVWPDRHALGAPLAGGRMREKGCKSPSGYGNSLSMVGEKTAEPLDSVAEILGRAFDSAAANLPPATAELILKAKLPEADVQRVDELLEQKRDLGLNPEQEALLRDYLYADSLLTVLKSKARRVLGQAAAA